jgi:hypothetical protein
MYSNVQYETIHGTGYGLEGDTPTERREGLVVFERRAEQGNEFGNERAF